MRWMVCLALLAALVACSRDRSEPTPEPPDDHEPVSAVFDAVSGADPVFLTAPAGVRPTPVWTDEAVVIATLTDAGDPVPHCGVLYAIAAMEFAVVEVEQGSVGAKTLSVAVGCPEMPPGGAIEHFTEGATYRLRLDQDYPDRVLSPAIDDADYWLADIAPAATTR